MYRIVKKEVLNQDVELMVIEAPFVARRCEPGQFIILRIDEDGERIPLTIVDYDRDAQTVTIIYQVVGFTTQQLSGMSAGEFLTDFVGPLGKATELKKHKRVLGIAGGVGAAPLYPQLRKLHEMGVLVDVIIGGRTKDHILLEKQMEALAQNVYIATNDGSKGHKGFVTEVLVNLLDSGEVYDEVIAIGPLIMMSAVVDITKERDIPTGVSLNPIMIDGTGMCGGCRVTVGGETKFACVDGPDFDGLKVDFKELITRGQFYKDEEKHICRIGARS